MLQRDAPDDSAKLLMRFPGGRLPVRQLSDIRARPDLGEGRSGSAWFGGLNHEGTARAVHRPGYGDRCGLALEPAGDNQGPADEQVGGLGRVGIRNGHATPVNLNIGERRVAHAREERPHDIFGRVVEAQVGDCPVPHPGHAFQQVAVYGVSDPETEYAGGTETPVYLGQNVGLVTDIAVRQKRDKAEPGRVVGKVEGRLDPLDHHGAALAVQARQVPARSRQVLLRRRDGLPAKLRGAVREADDLERIGRIELPQRRGDGFPGLLQWTAAHRTGAVDDEHHLHRPAGYRRGVDRRDQHQRQEPLARLRVPVRQQIRFDGRAGEPEVEYEIPVGHSCLVRQLHGRGRRSIPFDCNLVGRCQFLNAYTGVDTYADAEVVARPLRRRQVLHRGCYPALPGGRRAGARG